GVAHPGGVVVVDTLDEVAAVGVVAAALVDLERQVLAQTRTGQVAVLQVELDHRGEAAGIGYLHAGGTVVARLESAGGEHGRAGRAGDRDGTGGPRVRPVGGRGGEGGVRRLPHQAPAEEQPEDDPGDHPELPSPRRWSSHVAVPFCTPKPVGTSPSALADGGLAVPENQLIAMVVYAVGPIGTGR